jgi:hypothetical protein
MDAGDVMSTQKREYRGAALHSFIIALGHSHTVVQKILSDVGVDRIDPDRWYDFDWASSLYFRIGSEVGRAALIEVGRKMIESAEYPPGINSIHTLLMALGDAYKLNARGPDIGEITCEIEDEYSATMVWTPKFPCALNIGILEGSCSRYEAKALIEHGPGGCVEDGGDACTYHVSW